MAGVFADSALTAIEFPSALDQVSQYAVTPLGAERVRALRPSADRFFIESELARVAAAHARLAAGDDLEPVPFPDVAAALERLRLEGSVLEGRDLAALSLVFAAAQAVGAKLRRAAKVAPVLGALAAPPLDDALAKTLARAVDADGAVLDAASRDLARIRREVVELRQEIVSALERLLGGLDARSRVADAGVTLRNGRYVVPLRKDGRARLGGIVHDESATHATLFVEPPETIERGNRLRSLEAEEAREVQRILRELTALLRPHVEGLGAAFEMLVATDAVYARARCMGAQDAVLPALVDAGTAQLRLVGAAHPLLFARGVAIVRFDLTLEPGERTVLVSGPNTGGKTVLLKAVGLAAALAQSGVVPPVGEGSVLPVFADCVADIGDRQSISESLSTFSAHVAALREVLECATSASLVLLDELGTGTDPAEGAALAAAVLRALTARGVTTVATTHLGALKELAEREPGIVNASLAFDAATLAPTYRFTKGVPGRSYGLSIARRLGVREDVLREAEASLPADARRLDATLAAAEARSQELDRRGGELSDRAADLENLRARLALLESSLVAHEEELRRREKELERAVKHARRDALLEARTEVERAIADARAGREKEARRVLEQEIARLAEAAQTHGRTTEDAPTHRRTDAPDSEAGATVASHEGSLTPDPRSLVPGLKVRIRSLGIEGEIETVQGNDVAVNVRGRRVRVRAADIAVAGSSPTLPLSHSPTP
jgi:DNA mismatch repair protein MutS2